jgi:hypothetical protein
VVSVAWRGGKSEDAAAAGGRFSFQPSPNWPTNPPPLPPLPPSLATAAAGKRALISVSDKTGLVDLGKVRGE